MMPRRLIFLILFLLLFTAPLQAQDGGDLLARVNNLRASLNLPPYTLNGALSAAAQAQAQWMADTGEISHNHPDGSGPRTRAVNAGYGTTDVSENIYGGTNATADTAWNFWINSAVHYAGMVNSRYQEIGIGIAYGQLTTFVLVFGNPGGPAPFVPQTGAAAGNNAGPSAPPSYVVGVDEHGNIKHEVQPGDTLGDIALIYGYTWDDLPYMKQINGLTDNRALEVGSIFLVPPHDGTYTPVPGSESPTETPDSSQPTETLTATPTAYSSATPSPTLPGIATSAAMPEVIVLAVTNTPEPTIVAAVSTPVAFVASSGGTITRTSTNSPWLAAALVVQVGLLAAAGFEFIHRSRRKR